CPMPAPVAMPMHAPQFPQPLVHAPVIAVSPPPGGYYQPMPPSANMVPPPAPMHAPAQNTTYRVVENHNCNVNVEVVYVVRRDPSRMLQVSQAAGHLCLVTQDMEAQCQRMTSGQNA